MMFISFNPIVLSTWSKPTISWSALIDFFLAGYQAFMQTPHTFPSLSYAKVQKLY